MADQQDDLRFPNYADEEKRVGPVTMTQAGIFVGTVFFLIITKQIVLCLTIGVVLWHSYDKFKESASSNALLQYFYCKGLFVPRSHLFQEPSIDEFRE